MKRMKNHLKLLAASVALVASSPASAVCDGCVVSAVTVAGTTIVGTIAAQTSLLINEIAGAATAVSSMVIAGVGSSVIRSGEMVAESDAKLTARVHAAQTLYRNQITDPCAVVAAGQSANIGQVAAAISSGLPGGGSSTGTLPWASTGALAPTAGGRPNPGQVVMSVALGKAPAPEAEVLATAASQFGCAAFAAPGSTRARACAEADGPLWTPRNSGQRPNADVRAETLFDGPQGRADTSVPRRTIHGEVDSIATAALMRNLVDPLTLRDLKPAETRTDEGRRYLALQDTYNARIAVATQGLRDRVADMTADRETVPFLNNIAVNGGPQFQRYVNTHLAGIKDPVTGAAHDWRTSGVSPSEYRTIEANRRYRNPDWYAYLGRASDREQFIEMATLAATQVAMQVEMIEEMRRTRVAISMMAGGQVRSELLPSLARQHSAATR